MDKLLKSTAINHLFISAILLLSLNNILFAQNQQFDEQEFFSSIKTSYYNLTNTGAKNFVALVTSKKMEIFAKEAWNNSEVFPLQLIWFNPDKLYLSQQGVPKITPGKYQEYQEILNGIKMQLRGILPDLQRFYIGGFFDSINQEYTLQHNEEAVQITFSTNDPSGGTKVKYLFGYNALNILIQIDYPEQNKQIVIYPKFKTVKTKWLCTGWSVQTFIDNVVQSGFNLALKNRLIDDAWVPIDILIEVQKSDTKEQKFYDEIRLRNFLFNQSIEFSNQSKTNR